MKRVNVCLRPCASLDPGHIYFKHAELTRISQKEVLIVLFPILLLGKFSSHILTMSLIHGKPLKALIKMRALEVQ